MRRHLVPIAVVVIVTLAAASATLGEPARVGNLQISFDGSFTPHSLPRDREVPVEVTVKGRIGTTDGSHPPALRRLEIALNRAGRFSTKGLPICDSSQLQSSTTESALAICGPALIGRGRFGATLGFNPGNVPVGGTALAFNSRHAGKPALLLHFYANVPVQATFVLPMTIDRPSRGDFGTVFSARVPKLAGGLGSITDLTLTVGRRYNDGDARRSVVSAACAAPSGFPGAIFPFARASFHFVRGQEVVITLTRSCRVRGPAAG